MYIIQTRPIVVLFFVISSEPSLFLLIRCFMSCNSEITFLTKHLYINNILFVLIYFHWRRHNLEEQMKWLCIGYFFMYSFEAGQMINTCFDAIEYNHCIFYSFMKTLWLSWIYFVIFLEHLSANYIEIPIEVHVFITFCI